MEKGNDGKNEEHKKTRFCGVLRRLSVDIMGASRRKRGTVLSGALRCCVFILGRRRQINIIPGAPMLSL